VEDEPAHVSWGFSVFHRETQYKHKDEQWLRPGITRPKLILLLVPLFQDRFYSSLTITVKSEVRGRTPQKGSENIQASSDERKTQATALT
jgi:hypothetical protein